MKTLNFPRFVQFTKLLTSLSIILVFLYGGSRAVVSFMGYNVSVFEGEWVYRDGEYSASIPVDQDGEFCLCPAYECETMKEATLLAMPKVKGRREFIYFKDPQLKHPPRPKSMQPRRPMSVYSAYRIEVCYEKAAGSTLDLTLQENEGKLVLSVQE